MFFAKGTPVKSYAVNIIKHFLLKSLSKRIEPALVKNGIRHCHSFVGVLFTGMMTEKIIRQAISKLSKGNKENYPIEIIFHPGGAVADEEWIWKDRPELKDYYYSPWREKERNTIKEPNFRSLFRET